MIETLRIVVSLGIEGIPLACVNAEGFLKKLLLWTFLPLGLVVLTFVLSAIQYFAWAEQSKLRAAFKSFDKDENGRISKT